jgi:hypothetical protein
MLIFSTQKHSPAKYCKLAHLVAKSLGEVITYKPMIVEITGILTGSGFTNQLSILVIPGRVLDMMKNTITHFTLFKDPFAGIATQTHSYIFGGTKI